MAATVDSSKPSSKNTSQCSSKHASSESVLSKKESIQMAECKRKILAQSTDLPVIIRDENAILTKPQSKITMVQQANYDEELAASAPTQRNWRGILIALLVIAAVLGLIVFSIALLTPENDGSKNRGRRLLLNDVLSEKYQPVPFNGSWISDNEMVFRDRWGGLALFNADNSTTRVLMNNSTFRELNVLEYIVSSDLRYVLLISDIRRGFRYGRLARYYVYEFATRIKITLSPVEEDRVAPLLQYAVWSPTGNAIAFVHNNDIYYKPKVMKELICKITNNGQQNIIYNGVPDYLYETEVLRLSHSMWFSNDSQHLLFVSYNDSQVGEHHYTWYGFREPEPPAYPVERILRYPKPGTPNPIATVYVVNLSTPKFLFPRRLQFTSDVDSSWYVKWTSWGAEKQIAVLLLNRPQNVSLILSCSATNYTCSQIYYQESDGTIWSQLGGDPGAHCGTWELGGWCGAVPLLVADNAVITLGPGKEGELGGFLRAVSPKTILTEGAYDVVGLLGWDVRRSFLYMLMAPEGRPGERHLERIKLTTTAHDFHWPEMTECLTCPNFRAQYAFVPGVPVDSLNSSRMDYRPSNFAYSEFTSTPGYKLTNETNKYTTSDSFEQLVEPQCLFNKIHFSKSFTYFIQECLGPGAPYATIRRSIDSKIMWHSSNSALQDSLAGLAIPVIKTFRVEVSHTRAARVRLFLPPGRSENDELALPLVLHIDGTPGDQLITERFKMDWLWFLSSKKNYIVAQIDAAGTNNQGERTRSEIYRRMFSAEVEDQIAVLAYLRDTLEMVDSERVAVWGQGYGGGLALALASSDAHNLTKCVAAVAPIIDLQHHNSFTIERYMGDVGASSRGDALSRRAGNLASRSVLLAHATADTSVLPRHSLTLARALVDAEKLYRHQVYPDEDHTFSNSKNHLFKLMELFLDECFGPLELNDWEPAGFFAFKD